MYDGIKFQCFPATSGTATYSESWGTAKAYQATIYPPSGKAPGEGHALPLRGIAVWLDDVMRFLENNCR